MLYTDRCYLKEDIFQIPLENGYIMDLGWYPEFDLNGEFTLSVIADDNWEQPVFFIKTKSSQVISDSVTFIKGTQL